MFHKMEKAKQNETEQKRKLKELENKYGVTIPLEVDKHKWARRVFFTPDPQNYNRLRTVNSLSLFLPAVWDDVCLCEFKKFLQIQHLVLDTPPPKHQEPTESSKQPIRTRYLGHVTGYQPIRDQYDSVVSY